MTTEKTLDTEETPLAGDVASVEPVAPSTESASLDLPATATGAEIAGLLAALARSRVGPETRMQCKVCWYIYDPAEGCPEWQIEPGTSFADLPDYFTCPDCGHPLSSFIPAEENE